MLGKRADGLSHRCLRERCVAGGFVRDVQSKRKFEPEQDQPVM